MATGDISKEYDNRRSCVGGEHPVCGLTLEIVVADNTSDKTEVIDAAVHSCMDCLLTDLYLKAPAIATVDKKIKLELLTEDDDVIYSTGDLSAVTLTNHPIHGLQRGIVGKTAVKITCDANVSGAKSFLIKTRGV